MKLRNLLRFLFKSDSTPKNSVHTINLKSLEGEPFSLSRFKGKKLLIVNVASECGLTPQYEQLQKLYERFQDKLEVIGIPCNDFAGQEPGNPEQISQFCSTEYGITFMLSEKVNIRSEPIHPLYAFLTSKDQNLFQDSVVEWNFQKYLVDEHGLLTHVFPPATEPLSEAICSAISGQS